ncbi:GNAT family N-acetyltransferase [Methylibium sp.]|uniref:GNAT family N-acetyltransferase n=1 Tax=Methylibium sp. TaxID=2067992 RepID=UPI003D0D53CA
MSFLGGIAAALLVRVDSFHELAVKKSASLALLGCICVAIAAFPSADGALPILLLSVAFAIIAGGNSLFGLLHGPVSRTLGEMTYSIYLLHGIILFVTFNILLGVPVSGAFSPVVHWLVVAAITPVLILGAFATFRLIERPAMQRTTALAAWLRSRPHPRVPSGARSTTTKALVMSGCPRTRGSMRHSSVLLDDPTRSGQAPFPSPEATSYPGCLHGHPQRRYAWGRSGPARWNSHVPQHPDPVQLRAARHAGPAGGRAISRPIQSEPMSLPLLDNIAWHTLAGPQARFATGAGPARRYAPGFSPILGFEDVTRPDFAALAPYCEPGEHFYCAGWSGPTPAGWQVDAETTMHQMVWAAPQPAIDESFAVVRLGAEHVPQMLELVAATQPGPFGPRTVELGEYFGCFDGPRLKAMSGERMGAGGLREISGVCTHPDFQGRGLARRLMAMLVRRQLQRREMPFLHVMRDNGTAYRVYERMGFRQHQEIVVRVLARSR